VTPRRRLLAVVAVEAEAEALGACEGVVVAVAGIGRTNAAAATVEAILERGPFDAVCSVGIAGALPARGGRGRDLGDLVVGDAAVYAEEGIETPEGVGDMTTLGFPLGDFEGNRVPADVALLETLRDAAGIDAVGPIATVATCSGTDRRAADLARRTGAIAEAMEGAAVLHAARRRGVPAIEVRAISNTTGDRPRQRWSLPAAFGTLRERWPGLVAAMRGRT